MKFALFAAGKDVRKLANSGDTDAMYQLDLMYESGDGMIQNTPIALNRFRQAADQGHEKAKKKLGQLSAKYRLAPYTPKASDEAIHVALKDRASKIPRKKGDSQDGMEDKTQDDQPVCTQT